ncbi:MAG TPA: EF-hand domain-containing protein [Dokdonella sp.]
MKTAARFCIAAGIALVAGCASANYETLRSTSSGDGSNSDAAWHVLDSNGDGYLTVDELEQQHEIGLLQEIYVADTDHDDRVSRAEWNAWWPLMSKTEPSENMAALNASAAPVDGIRAH